MLCTQIYTCLFGVPEWTYPRYRGGKGGEEAPENVYPKVSDNLINYGRVVFQVLDCAIPVALILLSALGLSGVCSFSQVLSYSLLATGAALGISTLFLLTHNKWGELRAPKVERHYHREDSNFTTSGYQTWQHLNLGAPSVDRGKVTVIVD